MFSQFIAHEISRSVKLTLQDIIDGRYEKTLSKYLSLSVNYYGRDVKINFTTTDKEPITYFTVVKDPLNIDTRNLVFEVIPKSCRA